MNRSIKFRAWNKRLKRFMPDYKYLIGLDGQLYALDYQRTAFHIPIEDEIEFIQFTGLLDCEGKEIYEGDIIKHPQLSQLLVVTWDFNQWGLFDGICNEASLCKECKIIGNIIGHLGLK